MTYDHSCLGIGEEKAHNEVHNEMQADLFRPEYKFQTRSADIGDMCKPEDVDGWEILWRGK